MRNLSPTQLAEFVLNFLETFPTSIAGTIGNGMTPEQVRNGAAELRRLANMQTPIRPPEPPPGACDPRELP